MTEGIADGSIDGVVVDLKLGNIEGKRVVVGNTDGPTGLKDGPEVNDGFAVGLEGFCVGEFDGTALLGVYDNTRTLLFPESAIYSCPVESTVTPIGVSNPALAAIAVSPPKNEEPPRPAMVLIFLATKFMHRIM